MKLGHLDPEKKEVAVVGAGIFGLLTAYSLRKKGFSVKIYEKSQRTGGLISTEKTPWGLVEKAAHSFIMTESFQQLVTELNLKVLFQEKKGKARYIFRNGQLKKNPLRATEILSLLSRFFFQPIRASETLYEWGIRCLGKGATQYLLDPAIGGIYVGDIQRMEASAVFPSFVKHEGESTFRWLLHQKSKGKKRIFVFKDGTESFVQALENSLQAQTQKGVEFDALEFERLRKTTNIVLALPAYEGAALFRTLNSEPWTKLSQTLEKVEYVPLVVGTVFVKKEFLKKFKAGMGVLIPPAEGLHIKGILFNSSGFSGRVPDPGLESLTVFLGGGTQPEIVRGEESQWEAILKKELALILGLEGAWSKVFWKRWEKALPHYTGDLKGVWKGLEAKLPSGVCLAGNYTGIISIRGIIDHLFEKTS